MLLQLDDDSFFSKEIFKYCATHLIVSVINVFCRKKYIRVNKKLFETFMPIDGSPIL